MAKETLGDRVRRARIEAGLGLRELARRLSKTPSYLSDIENNRRVPSEQVLGAISRELQVDFDELMALMASEQPAGETALRATGG